MISLVVCTDLNGGIGYEGELLAHIPSELAYFKKLTSNKVCIMGRKTFESILERNGSPLGDGRLNVVITSKEIHGNYNGINGEEVLFTDDIPKIIRLAKSEEDDEVMVIGGEQVYEQFIDFADKLYVTTIMEEFDNVDTWFPINRLEEFKVNLSESFIDETTAHGYNITVYTK